MRPRCQDECGRSLRCQDEKRAQVQQKEAAAASATHRQAETRKLTPAQYVRRRTFGWTLVVLAVLIAVTHLLGHLGILYHATGLTDVTIG